MDTPIAALVIEDDEADYRLLERHFRKIPTKALIRAASLSDGIKACEQQNIDIILLDLTLPDSRGMDTVKKLTEIVDEPIVVLSGLDDSRAGLESVQLGAQDYLVKGSFDTDLLFRTIRYAMERNELRRELHATRQEVTRERELRRLQSDATFSRSSTERLLRDEKPLKSTHCSEFEQAVQKYSSILGDALEQRVYKIEHNVSEALRSLAHELRSYRGTPRDIVEIHTDAVNLRHADAPPEKSRVVNEEARYLLAGLLGHLCSIYRTDSLQLSVPPKNIKHLSSSDVEP